MNMTKKDWGYNLPLCIRKFITKFLIFSQNKTKD